MRKIISALMVLMLVVITLFGNIGTKISAGTWGR